MAKKKVDGESPIDKAVLTELNQGILLIYRKLLKEIESMGSLIVEVTSREGNKKFEIHPIVHAANQTGEMLRRGLSESMVTPKSKGTRSGRVAESSEDPILEMMKKFEELDDGTTE
jgi:hypothetical protein